MPSNVEIAAPHLASIAHSLGTAHAFEWEVLHPAVLAKSADAGLTLRQLDRFFATPHGRAAWPLLAANGGKGLESIAALLAVSQSFGDTLVVDPEAYDWIRQTGRRNPGTDELTAELKGWLERATDDAAVLRTFRRFRQLHHLRIGANDILRDRTLEEVTRELSRIADSSIKNALAVAWASTEKKLGSPRAPSGEPARLAAFAFGKLGGDELNYSSDIDLMFAYDADGETTKRNGTTNAEFFSRVVAEIVRLLSSPTDRGFAYRVDLRLRPEGQSGPLARSLASTLSYYDSRGRTWERQALIKLRPVAGDRELRKEFMRAIEPFVYRKYFSFSEINEVKALKRRMEQASASAGTAETDVKIGRGGIRDIEYTVQFLQLLNGGELPAVRQRNTLLALEALEIAGCLHAHETFLLSDAYRFLRRIEHRLQLLFDRQTHKLPGDEAGLKVLARRMGYAAKAAAKPKPDGGSGESAALPAQRRSPLDEVAPAILDTADLLVEPLDLFLKDYHDKTATNRRILNHLLHQTFRGDTGQAEPESDLVLDPDPDDATIRRALARYPFRHPRRAYENLSSLAMESVPFLSHRRCRHFLASLAPQLLKAVAETPEPDATLTNLERVTASLGAKAVLYELFSFNPASLKLYVDLCANSPYLCTILTTNPGMIDELLDSLVLDQPRSADELSRELAELLRGANDPEPILHSFQDKEFLRIGVQDLLGITRIQDTTAALSDVAETVLNAVFDLVEREFQSRGLWPDGASYAVLGLGKLGGREISYHSDLDVLLVYESASPDPALHHAMAKLMQTVIKHASHSGPLGKLYDIDLRLRPTGTSGSLAVPLDELKRYYATGCQLWERQALTRARVIRGEPAFRDRVVQAIREAILAKPWSPADAVTIAEMRTKLESMASPRSLKRGRGGLADVEFAVQLLQIKYGRAVPNALKPNAWASLYALRSAKLIPASDAEAMQEGYTTLRTVEACLRIVTDRPLTELPEDPDELARVARRTGYGSVAEFQAKLGETRQRIRRAYERLIERERTAT